MHVPWQILVQTALQTFILLWFVLLGLKLVGRRVFGELGPQDFILIMLLAEAMDVGLTPEGVGFWGSIVSGVTLLATVAFIERCKPLREWLEAKPVALMENGKLDQRRLDKFFLKEADLECVARKYGFETIDVFQTMYLEEDGSISEVLKPQFYLPQRQESQRI